MYNENYKAFLRKILKDLNKWRDTMFMDRNSVSIKISVLPKFSYKFNMIPIRIPAKILGIFNADSKIHMVV